MPVRGDELRGAMGRFATGVTVVTLLDDRDVPQGFTVNSLTSVSLVPPLVLVCVDHSANILRCFSKNYAFTVNILSEEQEEISSQFASKAEDKFAGIAYEAGKLGPPPNPGMPWIPGMQDYEPVSRGRSRHFHRGSRGDGVGARRGQTTSLLCGEIRPTLSLMPDKTPSGV